MDIGGVDKDNRTRFTKLILVKHISKNEEMLMKHIPGILANSFEFCSM